MASFVPFVTFAFGLDARVTLPESLLVSPLAEGITFGSFTESAFVTLCGPTSVEAATFSPPKRRGRAAMRSFGRPTARRTARAPARPVPVLAQPVRTVARRPLPRPHPVPVVRPAVRRPVPVAPATQVGPTPQRWQPVVFVPPVRVAVRRPAPAASVAQVAPAPQHRQPVAVVTPAVPAEVPRVRVSPPTSTRKRGAQTEVPSPSSGRISVFARLSHTETTGQTLTLPVVPVPLATQAVGSDVPSTSTSGLGRRARRNRNRRLRLAASEVERQQMVEAIAH
ncbi:hypothetical protein MA16_Dca022424 [Dendrobium catenatum]|uniref:Uncharacterized protein n=1 Tax=Dendrobium catenatum TaxID=906689 RepID=A0A2I0VJB9_9ASPA|nr:hypothetical protein MA16_Dca022424 [Dendrobium catenatum]